MLNDYLINKFKGKKIDELISFLNDLDEKYYWEGGVCQEGMPIKYSIIDTSYFVLYERTLQNCIFVKCKKRHKTLSELVSDFYIDPYDLIIHSCITINYDLENLNVLDLKKELEELNELQ